MKLNRGYKTKNKPSVLNKYEADLMASVNLLKMTEKFKKFFKVKERSEHYINVPALKYKALKKKIKIPKMSLINWTEHAWNPWRGCEKVSAACKNCYIARMILVNAFTQTVKAKLDTWMKPYLIKKPSLIFVCNYSDFFIHRADEYREFAWQIIKDNPQHTFQILTKRPERIKQCLPSDWGENGYDNVWLGITVEDDTKKVLKRLDDLRKIPASVRFVSVEPIYKEFNFTEEQVKGFDWFILGGESGEYDKKNKKFKDYRKCDPRWIIKLSKTLKSFGKAVWIKQLGTDAAQKLGLGSAHGEDWNEFPKKYRVREFPVSGKEPRNLEAKYPKKWVSVLKKK